MTDRRAHRLRHGRGFLLLDIILGPGFAEERSLEVARRIALITTAGLHLRGETPFDFGDTTFRPIAIDRNADELIMSHSSANFDRSGFVEDVNVVFPIHRFQELVANNTIGSLAAFHYSFMGAGLMPKVYAQSAAQVAGLLKQDWVDAVFLTPV